MNNLTNEQIAEQLLGIIADLSHELFPHLAPTLTLNADLSKDLQLDSLSRIELFSRIEKHFQIVLNEKSLIKVNTIQDLLSLILLAEKKQFYPLTQQITLPVKKTFYTPDFADTLMEVLQYHCEKNDDKIHLYLQEDSLEATSVTYQKLLSESQKVAAGLKELGILVNQPVALMLPTSLEYFYAFFGILLAGAIAVPLYPPGSYTQMEEHLRRQAGILKNAQCALLITIPEIKPIAQLLKANVETLLHIKTVDELYSDTPFLPVPRKSTDLALLQYTSGSTGAPKGVMLTHAMLLANIRIMGKTMQASAADKFVSWLPLYHDMGLIGAWLGCLYFGASLILMSPLTFLKQPSQWLWAIHRYQATLSASPNFGYALCTRKIQDNEIEGLDLSSWRLAFNGAEPVSAQTILQFTTRFSRYGFKSTAFTPVYGLAEASVGLSFTPANRGPLIENLAGDILMQQNIARLSSEENVISLVSSGQVLDGYQVRIVNDVDVVLPDRHIGHLQFQGPSCTQGYYRNLIETDKLFHEKWLDSGDMAYTSNGEIFITGRSKEMMIRAGRHIYPYALEEAIGDLPEIRTGRVAAFGVPSDQLGTEKLIVLAETKEHKPAHPENIVQQINSLSVTLLDSAPDEVELLPPGTLLKTSSGKMRRAAIKELYLQDKLQKGERYLWWQMLRLGFSSLPALGKRFLRNITAIAHTIYTDICFLVFAIAAFLMVHILPSSYRFHAIHHIARGLLRVWGIPLQIHQKDIAVPSIIVVNHSSYLDSLILCACLNRQLTFIAKQELTKNKLMHHFLKKLNTLFVERFDFAKGAIDAEKILSAAKKGETLVFFPEGTIQRAPGLMPFHMGAFVAASTCQLPITPIGIKGSREILPSDFWRLRRGTLEVTIGESILPLGNDWKSALAMRDLVYQKLLDIT